LRNVLGNAGRKGVNLSIDLGIPLEWIESVIGECQIGTGDIRFHQRAIVAKVTSLEGVFYFKAHRSKELWNQEVFGYEQWAPLFGKRSPQLIAVREELPYSFLVRDISGLPAERASLSKQVELNLWSSTGKALAGLHKSAKGTLFGTCLRDGSPSGASVTDAQVFILHEIDQEMARCHQLNALTTREAAIVEEVKSFSMAFQNEFAVPCHRDYNPANWLVNAVGTWTGLIDWEFSRWDVRAADFSRFPGWEWLERPDLFEAFLDGYGLHLSDNINQQFLVSRMLYAISAISWGSEHSYFGFVNEGRAALKRIEELI
jgi:hypothetical protein